MSARLLLLEDDPAIARTVAYALERDGLTVTHSLLVHDARQQLQRARFDLLVLVEGKSMREIARFVAEKLSTLEGVLSTSTHFHLKTYKKNGCVFEAPVQTERLAVAP